MQLPKQGAIKPTPNDIEAILRLYNDGQLPRALEMAQAIGPLHLWSGVPAQVMAGRLAGQVGAHRLANFLFTSAYRNDRRDLQANYYRCSCIFGSFGSFRAWKFLRNRSGDLDGPESIKADFLALEARVFAMFRDFSEALTLVDSALASHPDLPWLWCEKAEILITQDKHQEAYECAERSLGLNPIFRPSIRVTAETLQLLGRDIEALELLKKADQTLESGQITILLATLQTELDHCEDALASWIRARTLHPLAEPALHRWFAARLSDACYRVGDFEEAVRHASEAEMPFYNNFAERLKSSPRKGARLLPVEFVAQFHLTCAPATLSAISRYWKMPVDHAALAAEICYEGTSDHVERDWAERTGFVVRDFRLTWDTARQLIDAGVPVALATVETTSAHLQALIGYDDVRDSLTFRDPSRRVSTEVHAEGFFTRYGASGPRASVMIPPAETHRLDGIKLTDSGLYDDFYRMLRALERHDRGDAALHYSRMTGSEPEHRLTHTARRRLAIYDANPLQEVEAINRLVEQFPENGNLLWGKSFALSKCAAREEYRKHLRELANGPAAEPIFWRDWGREVGSDKRKLPDAKRYLTLAIRQQPCDGDHLAELANLLWDEHDFPTATTLYRFAACLPGGGERFGRSYFLAARHVRETDKAVSFLRKRFEDYAAASVQPTRALIFALSTLNRDMESLEILDQALALRPRDGELLLFAADEFARRNHRERAADVLEAARAHSSRSAWLRTAAALAGYRCEHAEALALWREILDLEPLAGDAQHSVARFLAETLGRAAALEFLNAHAEAFPHHLPLHELCVNWYRTEPAASTETVIRRALVLHPDHAWLKRELAVNLAGQGRHEEALAEAGLAAQIEPANPSSWATTGRILQLAGRFEDAAEQFRQAIALSVDFSYAIHGLFAVAKTHAQKREAVEYVRRQLADQVVFGDGVTSFREEAYPVLEPEEMLAVLQEAAEARRDLWQTGAALAWHLSDMQLLDEALTTACAKTSAFPLIPRVWFDLALVRQRRGERAEEREALERALAINPTWSQASRALAEVYEREGNFEKSRDVLRQAVSHEPLEHVNHGCLADILWKEGDRENAMAMVEHALRLNPDYQWGWNALAEWSRRSGVENRSLALAREFTTTRAGEARSWIRLVEHLPDNPPDEKLSALQQAGLLEPHNIEIHDLRCTVLCTARRLDEALAACRPAVFNGNIPLFLRGREAWLEAHRGNLALAVSRMRELVEESPSYYWGWTCLTEWLCQLERLPEALETAKTMARLAPRASIPLGHVANIEMRMGRNAEATEAFRKAFHLDPSYAYAGFQLFAAQLTSSSLVEARETLKLLQTHHPGAAALAASVRLSCALDEKKTAISELNQLCFMAEEDTRFLAQAGAAVLEAGWAADAERLYESILLTPHINAEIGSLWIDAMVKHRGEISNRFSKSDPASPVGLAARFSVLEHGARLGQADLVATVIARDRQALRSTTRCWGQAGYALVHLGRHKDAATWLSDWRNRPDLEPWMLHNLAFALRHIGNDTEAHEVNLRAVNLKGDNATFEHHLYLAWDAVAANDLAGARNHLGFVGDDSLQSYFNALRALVQATLAVMNPQGASAAAEFDCHKAILKQPAWTAVFQNPALSRYGKIAVDRMAVFSGKRAYSLGNTPLFTGNQKVPWFLIVGLCFVVLNLLRSCSTESRFDRTPPRSDKISPSYFPRGTP